MVPSDENSATGKFLEAGAFEEQPGDEVLSPKQRIWDTVLFTSYGLLNNGLICVVYGGAQDIMRSFGYPDSAPLVTLITTIGSIVGPLHLLAWPLQSSGFRVRAIVANVYGLSGLLVLAFSTKVMATSPGEEPSLMGASVAMLAAFLVALQQSIGENIACMRFRRFSKRALSCWGAGTGFAGIFPPLLYGALSSWPLYSRFLIVIPILAIYFGICLSVYDAGRRRDATVSLMEDQVDVSIHTPDAAATAQLAEATAQSNEAQSLRMAWSTIVVFSGVYGLEYFIFPTLVDRATQCSPTSPLGHQAYNNSWICYNIGVTISRASIAFITLPYLWPLVVLQAANVAFWAVEVYFNWIPRVGSTGYIVQYVVMLYVGLMGGSAYANCMRSFHCDTRIPAAQRDKLVNYAFAVSMLVILASTGLGELLDNTILTNEFVTRNCPGK